MLPYEFQINWPFGSGEQRKIDFQDGCQGGQLGFLIQNNFNYFWSKYKSPQCFLQFQVNWLLRQKAITMPMCKSLDKHYRDTCICQWKLHVYLYLSMKKYIGNIVCLTNNINR